MDSRQDNHQGSGRSRRAAAETGSFGKSTRRSRSKTGTPVRREDPTIAAADKVFSTWIQNQPSAATATSAPQRKQSLAASASQPNLLSQTSDENGAPAQSRFIQKQEPTEVILRGYRSSHQQYAAVNHFENLAGRICEDYPRDPPIENRRYKSELRDPAFTRRRALTPEERAKVNRADGGEHWVKVTFESAEMADLAIYSSPQSIFGYLVYAEPYHGVPPARDEPVVDTSNGTDNGFLDERMRSSSGRNARLRQGKGSGLGPRSFSTPVVGDGMDSPVNSQASSRTADTTTVTSMTDSATASSATISGAFASGVDAAAATPAAAAATTGTDSDFCRAIPTARKVKLLPAEQALLPQPSYTQRVLNRVPFLRWFSGSMIGNEVPRTETGEFDWDKASLYWKFIYWLDSAFGLFGGEILSADKDD